MKGRLSNVSWGIGGVCTRSTRVCLESGLLQFYLWYQFFLCVHVCVWDRSQDVPWKWSTEEQSADLPAPACWLSVNLSVISIDDVLTLRLLISWYIASFPPLCRVFEDTSFTQEGVGMAKSSRHPGSKFQFGYISSWPSRRKSESLRKLPWGSFLETQTGPSVLGEVPAVPGPLL